MADTHGQIQQAAREAGMDTQAFCDMNCRTFEACIPLLDAVERMLTCWTHVRLSPKLCRLITTTSFERPTKRTEMPCSISGYAHPAILDGTADEGVGNVESPRLYLHL